MLLSRIPGRCAGQPAAPGWRRRGIARFWRGLGAGCIVALALAGCGKSHESEPVVRPVRLLQVQAGGSNSPVTYSGDIRARIESALAFRVGGKITARLVDVGAIVRKGQVLARLDLADLTLAEAASRAQLEAAKTERDLARSDLKRFNDLFTKGFISAAEQQRRQATFDAAEARYRQALAGLHGQANQLAYGELLADADGVVTAIDAEVGQVVSAGQPVVRVARVADKEVLISVPEDQVGAVRSGQTATIRLWANDAEALPGRVREIAPAADAATRTYMVRVAIPNPPPSLKLGMTATVELSQPDGNKPLSVPLTALLYESDKPQVWVFDTASQTVSPVAVTVGGPVGNNVAIAEGLKSGQIIVTAGVHLLKAGQKVRPMDVPLQSAASAPATRE